MPAAVYKKGLFLALLLEALTCFARFGLDLQSTRDTPFMAKFTFGIRIHHSYPGLIMLVLAIFSNKPYANKIKAEQVSTVPYFSCLGHRQTVHEWLVLFGISLLVSDFIHHFLVLWIITGHHEFDLTYPTQ